MKIKDVMTGIGFVLMMIGGASDMDYSDARAVAAVVLTGCLLMWLGGKDYDSENDTY